jgi:hypothetical protein
MSNPLNRLEDLKVALKLRHVAKGELRDVQAAWQALPSEQRERVQLTAREVSEAGRVVQRGLRDGRDAWQSVPPAQRERLHLTARDIGDAGRDTAGYVHERLRSHECDSLPTGTARPAIVAPPAADGGSHPREAARSTEAGPRFTERMLSALKQRGADGRRPTGDRR